MKRKIINLLDQVTTLLTKKSHLRDSDRRLICNIWWKAAPHPELLMFEDFIKLYIDGKIPESDSITRCRRKVQEEIEELRGENWEKRHKLEELVVKEIEELGITI